MREHGLSARKSLGQHFLVDPNTARRIVSLANLDASSKVLEIGPGLGSLTVVLAGAVARVVAIELDEKVASILKGIVPSNVEIICADAMKTHLDSIDASILVANLPYSIATPLMAKVLEQASAIERGAVMVQKELGRRWTARPGSKTYGAISVKFEYYCEARVTASVPRSVFLPPPKVESVLVSFERRPPTVHVDDPAAFFKFVSSAFAHRRKILANALKSAHYEPTAIPKDLPPNVRPEQVGLKDFVRIFDALQ